MTIKEANGIIAVRMHDGDSFTECVKAVAKDCGVNSAVLHGIGLFKNVELGYFNGHEYVTKSFYQQLMEVISLEGNISVAENGAEVVIHAHCVLGLPDYSLIGGHLMDGTFFNGELFIQKLEGIKLVRRSEPSGLNGLWVE
ncbi:PPC domain-containing DNA-binding protein [Coprothermobacter proteolyticus]|uniref:PPC domain-containing DNA-binding protein n=1 Tax=Coprothermobacter proteolyticus TaxID=35786 RepID=UPI000D30F038|nr:DUF296 domain-containing protein [Coprothermobacter proteolyticus]